MTETTPLADDVVAVSLKLMQPLNAQADRGEFEVAVALSALIHTAAKLVLMLPPEKQIRTAATLCDQLANEVTAGNDS